MTFSESKFHRTARTVAALTCFLLLACATAGAVAQSLATPGLGERPALHFKQNLACAVALHCQIPASPVFPNPNDYTTLATLSLPRGDYLVTSKLSAFIAGGTTGMIFECALVDAATSTPMDYSSFDGFSEQTLFLQTALTIRAREGGSVRIGCRAFGFKPDGSLVDMHVWNVNIAALSVGTIRQEFQ
jgi:hypothetical protein